MKEKIKVIKAIKLFELKINGLDKINSAYVEIKNLKERKDKYIADVIIGIAEEGYSQRFNNCEYPKSLIQSLLQSLEQ